jgi:hypothetical protein
VKRSSAPAAPAAPAAQSTDSNDFRYGEKEMELQ